MTQFGFGQSVRRTEDMRLVKGEGQFTSDLSLPGQAYAVMVRSPVAHARILSVDTHAAREMEGVLGVFTGADALVAGLGSLPCHQDIQNRDGSDYFRTHRPIFAHDAVRYVGDTMAMVVATSVDIARDAVDLIEFDFEDLPVIADLEEASQSGAPVIWEELGSNIVLDWEVGQRDATDAAFAKAAHVTKLKLVNNRVVVNAMEPRAALGDYDAQEDAYTLYAGSQGVHSLRELIARDALKIPKEKLRLITGDVGGGFGMKSFHYPEYAAVLWASRELGCPVKWVAERTDSFITDTQGRDNISECTLAFDEHGKALAVRTETLAGMGAYLSQYSVFIPTEAGCGMQVGVYAIPALYTRVKCVLTNTVPVDAYRGAGRPEAMYVIERLMEQAAVELGMSPVEIRRRNFVRPDQMPYSAPNGFVIDSGRFEAVMDRALERADWNGFEARRAESQARGQVRGRGLCYYMERTGQGFEMASIDVRPSGEVVIAAGTQSNGQGHETAYAQLVADRLGIDFTDIRMERGDTDILPAGEGTGGSRSLTMAGMAFDEAVAQLVASGKALAAAHLKVDENELVYEDGAFLLPGTNKYLSLFDVAGMNEEPKSLVAVGRVNHEHYTFPNGCHVCEVEIDSETGVTGVVRYTVVDDFGHVLNPMLVEGQVQGGVAQGLGQAMGEHALFDPESGQPINASFVDYWMPRADTMPVIDFSTLNTPCTTNSLGVKGCGEAGTVGAAPAFVNAVLDALRPFGISHLDMPVTPLKVWQALQDA